MVKEKREKKDVSYSLTQFFSIISVLLAIIKIVFFKDFQTRKETKAEIIESSSTLPPNLNYSSVYLRWLYHPTEYQRTHIACAKRKFMGIER